MHFVALSAGQMAPSGGRKAVQKRAVTSGCSVGARATCDGIDAPQVVELWDREGNVVRTMCDLPLAENIPIAFNSCRKGPRSISWRSDKPSTLYWAECQDGGDPAVSVSPRCAASYA